MRRRHTCGFVASLELCFFLKSEPGMKDDLQATADLSTLTTSTKAHWLSGHGFGCALEGGVSRAPVLVKIMWLMGVV